MKYFVAVILFLTSVVGASPPKFELKDVQGNTHNFEQYRGKIVVLNFWATWCAGCKTEMPIFIDLYKKYRDRGVVVLAASVDDEKTRRYVAQYARVYKMQFPILVDATPDMMHELGLGDALPSTIFLDSEGTITGRIIGQAQRKDVLHRIEWLLGNHDGDRPGQ